MGKRVHVATEYKVEYADGQFNWEFDDFWNILSVLEAQPSGEDEYTENYDVDKEYFEDALNTLKKIKKGKTKDIAEYVLDDLMAKWYIGKKNTGKFDHKNIDQEKLDYWIKEFEYIKKNGYTDDGYYHFAVF